MGKTIEIERNLCESRAYFALGGAAPQLLTIFINRCSPGQDRSCTLPYTEARDKFGLTRPRFTRGIDDLLAKGFISILHPGGYGKRDMVRYTLSDNWRSWEPGITFESRSRSPKSRNVESASAQALLRCPDCGGEGQCSDGCLNVSNRKTGEPVTDKDAPVTTYKGLQTEKTTQVIEEGVDQEERSRITPVSNCDGEWLCKHAALKQYETYSSFWCLCADMELDDLARCPLGRWAMPQ